MAGLLGRLELGLPNGQERDQISDKAIEIIDDKMINVEYDSDNSLDDVSTDLPSETVEANGVYYIDNVAQADVLKKSIANGFASEYVPDTIMAFPRRQSHSQRQHAQNIAQLVFPDYSPEKALIHYEKALSHARRVARQRKELEVLAQYWRYKPDGLPSLLRGPWLGQEVDPVSLDGPPAFPMPVEIGSEEDFEDVFNFLQRNADPKDFLSRNADPQAYRLKLGKELKWNTPMVEFKRGVVYEDGRLDLCKMVVGPTHVEKLLDSLEDNTMITQFLLGNNVSSTTGARRIAKFIADHPDQIETWYLAGNHIRPPSFKLLVDSMICSSRITNVWLKRNPLTAASVFDIHRLVTNTPNLRTLDLENTELGDVGVTQLFSQLTGKEVPLRNLYLNSNGIGVNGSKSLASFLAHPSCKLESLYLSSNPIGDAGAIHLAAALKSNTSLIRIAFCSTGLTSEGIADLSYALSNHPSIRALMLAASMTTEAHRQRFNHIADSAISALVALMSNPSMQFLTLGRVAFSVEGWETVKAAVEDTNICDLVAHRLHAPGEAPECSLTLRKALAANVERLYPKEEGYETFASGMGARSLYSCADVRLIDSVYRTRDKYGGGHVQQYWTPGDPVWKLVDEDV